MAFPRRRLLAVAPPGSAAAFSVSGRAFAQTTDLAVTCDAAAVPAVIAAGSADSEPGCASGCSLPRPLGAASA